MPNSLKAWIQDVVMGIRENRHFSIALQRRYLDYGKETILMDMATLGQPT